MMLQHSYAAAIPTAAVAWQADQFPDLTQVFFNDSLATQLAITNKDIETLLQQPGFALGYAGDQFGNYVPQLGDGRAILLGECQTSNGLIDLHAKGSGRTPFSRGGDGKAPAQAMLKEVLYSEALFHLHVPTTRVLAMYHTGETILRQHPEPGALVVRTAASHIRVGTFQYVSAQGEQQLQALAEYVRNRHFPDAATYADMFIEIVQRQASLVAKWMRLGFVHGVLNSDNTLVSGESIDYGPCAFTDWYDPHAVFSSIDYIGRYAFGRQPEMVGWNLARLAQTLIPLCGSAWVQEAIHLFAAAYRDAFTQEFATALGITHVDQGIQAELIADCLALLTLTHGDSVQSLRALSEQNYEYFPSQWQPWLQRWRFVSPDFALMCRINPVYIPRNHIVSQAMHDATVWEDLLTVVQNPYTRKTGKRWEKFEQPTPAEFGPYTTVCGT
ncbi:protein adenylyltransferase SelO family protein [Corynebacterium sp. HS2168-gen11]|uniref:protein adenylyltransferase SelO family protein n=1 Tax=Corynebacterium sp. HS2168-gen11 TaxID=2974027 RepID=UPI00216B01E9|nr:protein adenylyltransferase SelO family protein [Corynebacterium sp. HS2168-gen11]MCS4536312.1 protein adenylyltransferase SelO family protein [Corynebacterium sp. HS2168-gen11]